MKRACYLVPAQVTVRSRANRGHKYSHFANFHIVNQHTRLYHQRTRILLLRTATMLFYTFLIAAIMATVFAQEAHIFDFAKMPTCADRCVVLHQVERFCLQKHVDNQFGALTCVCTSQELYALHFGIDTCRNVCGSREREMIHLYYNELCGWEKFASPTISPLTTIALESSSTSNSPSATTAPLTPLSTVPNGPTGSIDSPSPTPTATNVDNKAEAHGTWVSAHSRYLIVAGVMLGVTLAGLLLLAFILHRRRQKAELERAYQANGLIPLHLLSRQQTPIPASAPISAENLPAIVPSSPLETSPSSHSFGETLRSWEREDLERAQARDELRMRVAEYLAGRRQAT